MRPVEVMKAVCQKPPKSGWPSGVRGSGRAAAGSATPSSSTAVCAMAASVANERTMARRDALIIFYPCSYCYYPSARAAAGREGLLWWIAAQGEGENVIGVMSPAWRPAGAGQGL